MTMASCRAVLVLWALALAAPILADEGFWTFENPPLDRLREAGLTTSPEGLERMRRSSLRFMDGGSGAFVSKDGLMATNHHVALECLQNLSTKDVDLLTTGFVAPSRDKEPACPGYEVNALVRTEDVTARVQQAVTSAMSDKEAADARKAASARLRSECAATSGLRCDMVSLYQGGEYHLYAYKTYTDVRLVFAPEQEIAFFGGDPDNYTYPRHDFDVCFFRAYENGRPAVPPAFLPWIEEGHRRRRPRARTGQPRALRTTEHPRPARLRARGAAPFGPQVRRSDLPPWRVLGRGAPSRRGAASPTPSSSRTAERPSRGRLLRALRREGDGQEGRRREDGSAHRSRPTRPCKAPSETPGARSRRPCRSPTRGWTRGASSSVRSARCSSPRPARSSV